MNLKKDIYIELLKAIDNLERTTISYLIQDYNSYGYCDNMELNMEYWKNNPDLIIESIHYDINEFGIFSKKNVCEIVNNCAMQIINKFFSKYESKYDNNKWLNKEEVTEIKKDLKKLIEEN